MVLPLAFFALLASSIVEAAPKQAKSQTEAYRLAVLMSKPVGYWRLGETSATAPATDESGNGRHGKYAGQVAFETKGAIAGDPNGAVALGGQGYVEIPDDPSFSQPTSGEGLTVEVWLRPDKLDFAENAQLKYTHWLGKGEAGQNEWGFRFYTLGDSQRANRMSAYIWNLDGALGAGAYVQEPITVGQWIHFVACYEPGNAQTLPPRGVELYKNGVGRQGPPASGTLYANPPDWFIKPERGKSPVRLGTREQKTFLVGALDEVAIYPRVLTANEIRLHYEIGVGARMISPAEIAKAKKLLKTGK